MLELKGIPEGLEDSSPLLFWKEKREVEELTDRELVCKICGKRFIFSKHEQKLYQEFAFKEPKRCPACRRRRPQREGVRKMTLIPDKGVSDD